jgi:hypothetical protein
MILEEFIQKNRLCGRVIETHDTNGYAFKGTVKRFWQEGNIVHFELANYARRYEAEGGSWRHLPNYILSLGGKTPTETAEGGVVFFSLPGNGRGYFLPRGTKAGEERNAKPL